MRLNKNILQGHSVGFAHFSAATPFKHTCRSLDILDTPSGTFLGRKKGICKGKGISILPSCVKVCWSPEQVTGTLKSITASSSDFLVIGLHFLGSAVVNNFANVGFINAHSKGYSSYNTLGMNNNAVKITLRLTKTYEIKL